MKSTNCSTALAANSNCCSENGRLINCNPIGNPFDDKVTGTVIAGTPTIHKQPDPRISIVSALSCVYEWQPVAAWSRRKRGQLRRTSTVICITLLSTLCNRTAPGRMHFSRTIISPILRRNRRIIMNRFVYFRRSHCCNGRAEIVTQWDKQNLMNKVGCKLMACATCHVCAESGYKHSKDANKENVLRFNLNCEQ